MNSQIQVINKKSEVFNNIETKHSVFMIISNQSINTLIEVGKKRKYPFENINLNTNCKKARYN
jgi:hypothetical protein